MSVSWTSENAAHLLRRAGFAATAKDVKKALKKGLSKTIKGLLQKDKKSDKLPKWVDGTNDLQYWWLERMATTHTPLTEKLTLLWHNHFATAMDKVGSVTRMHNQNRTLRKHSMGAFRDLVLGMSRDPAMIRWLDNNTNKKGSPNENYARELMELFTTGVLDKDGVPNYTETDVQEGARAFTGWTYSGDDFYFSEWYHDYGSKTFRGQTGPWDGTDIVDMLALDPATARRVAWRLWTSFAYEVDLDDAVLDSLAQTYLDHDTQIKPMLEHMFSSDAFYSAEAKNALVKGPAELVINITRLLKAKLPKQDWSAIANRTGVMGQELFNPPTVFGWNEGLQWVAVGGLLDRVDVMEDLTGERGKDAFFVYKPASLLGKKKDYKSFTAEQTVDKILSGLGPLSISAAARQALIAYAQADSGGQPVAEFTLDSQTIDMKVRGIISLAASLPEFQVH